MAYCTDVFLTGSRIRAYAARPEVATRNVTHEITCMYSVFPLM